MQVKAQTASYLHAVVTTTGELTVEGRPVQRTTVPAQFQRNYNAVTAKLLGRVEVALSDVPTNSETQPPSEPEWVAFSKDFKSPEGKRIVAERWTDGELELTDGEKKFVAFCVKGRDEVPAATDETLDEFEALTKI